MTAAEAIPAVVEAVSLAGPLDWVEGACGAELAPRSPPMSIAKVTVAMQAAQRTRGSRAILRKG